MIRGWRSFLFLAGCTAALMCSVGASQAQTAASPAAASKTPATSRPAGTAPRAPNPAGAASTPAAPRLLAQRFDDWVWRCVVPGDASAATSCEVAQSVTVNQDGRAIDILNLAISRANDKAGKVSWAMVALTPLDVFLPDGFGLTVGDDTATAAKGGNKKDNTPAMPTPTPYRNCNQLGCFVIIPLDDPTVIRLRTSQEGAGFFRLLNGKTVKVVFSLKGFDKAFASLASKALPPPVVANMSAPQATAAQPAPASQAKQPVVRRP